MKPPGRYIFRVQTTRIPVFQASRFAIRWFNCQTPARIDHPLAGAALGPVDDWGSRIACCLQGDIAIVGCAVVLGAVVLFRQLKTSVGGVSRKGTDGKVGLFALAFIGRLGRISWLA